MTKEIIALESIAQRILVLRGQMVMIDADLAELYDVDTKRLNEQVKRNIERFPSDFMFQLSAEEKIEVVANCDHLAKLKYSQTLPQGGERVKQLFSPLEPLSPNANATVGASLLAKQTDRQQAGSYTSDAQRSAKQRGISLIELIIFIVIISVALTGILLVMNQTTAHSADPMVRKQALAIAESILEEVELMPFTYCDPDDPAAGLDTTVDTTPCTLPAGGEDAAMGPEAGETRYSATTPFDNVSDYHGFNMPANSIMDITNTNTGVNGYTLQPITVAAIDYGGITAASGDALLITVTVTDPSGTDIVLEGIRTRYSPRSLP